jgi:hypothetical protein
MKKTIIILSISIMASCAGKTQNTHFGCNGQTNILGKWEFLGTGAPEHYLTFKENGECISRYFYGNGKDSIVEKYAIDGQRIKLFLVEENFGGKKKTYSPNDTDFAEFEYELSGDSLIIKNRIYLETTIFEENSKKTIYKDAIYKKINSQCDTLSLSK